MKRENKKDAARIAGSILFHFLPFVLLAVLGAAYPFVRELAILYFVTEGIGFYLKARAWYLTGSRVFLWGISLFLILRPMGYFQANIMIAASMALLLSACIAGILSERRKKRQRRYGKIIGAAAAGAVLYLVLGILISGFKQPEISGEFQQNFDVNSFYGQKEAADRAVIIEDNGEALLERVRMIRNAKERIILSTFDFRDDEMGRIMIAALLEAADRGVNVRVVVDGVSGLLRMEQNPYFFALSSHPDAEVRIYNKINLLKPWALMGRLHDKYLIVDEMAYVLGGRNTFSYFLGNTEGHKNYDRDVFVYNAAGSGASSLYQVEAYFEGIWNHKATGRFHDSESTARRASVKNAREDLKKLYDRYLAENPAVLETPDYTAMTYPVRKITLLANPTGTGAKEPTVFYALAALMENAEEAVTIHTPYIICNEMMYDAFSRISKAVPEARMMTNSAANNGNPFGSGDYQKNFNRIMATGIRLYEYEGGISYHGKSIVIDNNISIVGSFNMDMRSVYLDTELMLVIDSDEVNTQLREIMAGYEAESGRVLADGTRVYPEGVVPQEMSTKKRIRVKLIYTLLGWARRLL